MSGPITNETSEIQDIMHADDDLSNLIVNYLPITFTDEQLRALFEDFGEIRFAKVIKDRATKLCIGYGFVRFALVEDALTAMRARNGMLIESKILKVSFARPQSEDIKNSKLFVNRLHQDTTDEQVRNMFAKFGNIIECRVILQSKFKPAKKIAFVQYSLRCEAEQALSMDGYVMPGTKNKISVSIADVEKRKTSPKAEPVPASQPVMFPTYPGTNVPVGYVYPQSNGWVHYYDQYVSRPMQSIYGNVAYYTNISNSSADKDGTVLHTTT